MSSVSIVRSKCCAKIKSISLRWKPVVTLWSSLNSHVTSVSRVLSSMVSLNLSPQAILLVSIINVPSKAVESDGEINSSPPLKFVLKLYSLRARNVFTMTLGVAIQRQVRPLVLLPQGQLMLKSLCRLFPSSPLSESENLNVSISSP